MSTKLIITSDDYGVADSVNSATLAAYDAGLITSFGVIVLAPLAEKAVMEALTRSTPDIGIHLTLTSEWQTDRWRPLSCGPSLIDESGFLYRSIDELNLVVNPVEAEEELESQITRALSLGIEPSHLSCHMASCNMSIPLNRLYRELGRRYSLPVRDLSAQRRQTLTLGSVARTVQTALAWERLYLALLSAISAEQAELIVHLGTDTVELRRLMGETRPWGARWRHLDTHVIGTAQFREAVRRFQLVGWRSVR